MFLRSIHEKKNSNIYLMVLISLQNNVATFLRASATKTATVKRSNAWSLLAILSSFTVPIVSVAMCGALPYLYTTESLSTYVFA